MRFKCQKHRSGQLPIWGRHSWLAKSNSPECQEGLLKILCYLAASLKSGIPVKAVSQAHLAVAHYIQYWKDNARALYEAFLTPFVESYWMSRFSKQRFRFGSPRFNRKIGDKTTDKKKRCRLRRQFYR